MPGSSLRVALTGGIASGKTHCLARLASLGARVIDADAIARDVVNPGTPGFTRVVARFGRTVVGADGALDRPALAGLVFHDAGARKDLEAIVHPAVYAAIAAWFDGLTRHPVSFSDSGKTIPGVVSVAVADIPLLYKTGHAGDFDKVVVTSCPAEVQLARLIARDGLSEADARARLAAQLPLADKTARADYVIDTSGSIEHTDAEITAVWTSLQSLR